MTATDELRCLLDERGVEYRFNDITKVFEWHFEGTDGDGSAHATEVNGGINIIACSLTPEQAVAATLGPRMCREVYLVETSDDLIESWYPIGVYLNSKAAGDCAEALRGEVDGMRQFARVVELKVVDDG